jgi:hypothetical protein
MRHPLASHAQALTVAGLASFLCACSTTVTQEPIATSSLAPRPEVGMMHNAPSPRIETGSLGNASAAPMATEPRYRWSQSPRPSERLQPNPPLESPQPDRWQAAPAPRRMPDPAHGRPTGSQVVIVREGDTLFGLSRRYGVPVTELVAANRLTSGRIEIGQRLIVPARGPSLAQRRY